VLIDTKTGDCLGHLFQTKEEAIQYAIPYVHKERQAGFSLLEALIVLTLMSLASVGFVNMLNTTIKVNKQLTTKLETATNAALSAIGRDKRVLFPNVGECKALVGNWYAKRVDTRIVGIYKSNNCVANYLGTLTALSNPTYDDTETNTFWNVSGEGSSLRLFIMKENL
jgi:prepilin-type N-terminal cleavage/methylation domain-containing protein